MTSEEKEDPSEVSTELKSMLQNGIIALEQVIDMVKTTLENRADMVDYVERHFSQIPATMKLMDAQRIIATSDVLIIERLQQLQKVMELTFRFMCNHT